MKTFFIVCKDKPQMYASRRHESQFEAIAEAVRVMDDLCADPYFISRNEYLLYQDAYAGMEGIKVMIK